MKFDFLIQDMSRLHQCSLHRTVLFSSKVADWAFQLYNFGFSTLDFLDPMIYIWDRVFGAILPFLFRLFTCLCKGFNWNSRAINTTWSSVHVMMYLELYFHVPCRLFVWCEVKNEFSNSQEKKAQAINHFRRI